MGKSIQLSYLLRPPSHCDSDTLTLLHRSSPDISFAPSFLDLSSSWKVLQDLSPDHLPISLTASLSPLFFLNERPHSFNFLKARLDGFAFYFDPHCPSAEKYSISLSYAAALFTSLAVNAAKVSIPFGSVQRQSEPWWSPEVEKAVSERQGFYCRS